MANSDNHTNSKKDADKSDDLKESSDTDMGNTNDEMKEVNGRSTRKRKRRRDVKRVDPDKSDDDDSESEDHCSKRLKDMGSPGPHSPSHSATREPRSCVLNQRQKRKPLSRLLEQLLRNLEKKDQNQFFAWPVTDNYAPNYSTIIKKPMDFSTMKQKIDDNQYKSLNCFISDFKLMCNNALRYNKPGTVYHKAARKLLHLGLRQLQPEKLRPLGNMLTYMYEIPIRELGFDMGKMDVKALKNNDDAKHTDDNHSDAEDEKAPLSADDEIKLKMEAIREQHRKRLAKRAKKFPAFPRMDSDGYTSLQVLVDNDGMAPTTNQRPVSLGLYTGRISHGTATLQGFKEHRRNFVKGVKPLNYGPFASYAPSYDSTFASISKDDCHLLYHTYGEETGLSSNESTLRFAPDSPWSCIYDMDLLFPPRNNPPSPEPEYRRKKDVKIDVEKLKSLSEIGIDVDFLGEIEDEISDSQYDFGLEHTLKQNSNALKKLESEQIERLSMPIPAHLSNIAKPTLSELETARVVVTNLKDMVSRVHPHHVAPLSSIRKAMGVTLDHLDTPMTVDELHELSPEHAIMPEQLSKENSNQHNDDTSSTLDNTKSEEESIENGEDEKHVNGVKDD